MSPKTVFAVAVSLGALLLALPVAADDDEVVTATGQGLVEVVPDIARLSFGITARNPAVAAARDEVAEGVARLIRLARELGVDDDHISTAELSVSQDFSWDPETRERRLEGFIVSRQVLIRLAELDKLGELAERALELGVTEASPPAFDTSRREALENEALAAAARDARGRAEVMARALGVQAGEPVRIDGGLSGPGPRPLARMAMAEADMASGAETYQPGLIRISASVTASFEIKSK
ncbi:SIMPL domain-containing protein [Wenzhouxiangella sp. XN24]|uniref:SIMPL domain-containing protein n=1 Tax=Wenzhouxiangella sp. XN24 TaxID=2713569 RepID=UPI0013EB91CB|nr:SIMPL domain-containing protein [Wenzhouxiangella sp. XN24]NGX17535.1 SIMPL domain-containing protein [Wenzhouxiangella sp. XN24]